MFFFSTVSTQRSIHPIQYNPPVWTLLAPRCYFRPWCVILRLLVLLQRCIFSRVTVPLKCHLGRCQSVNSTNYKTTMQFIETVAISLFRLWRNLLVWHFHGTCIDLEHMWTLKRTSTCCTFWWQALFCLSFIIMDRLDKTCNVVNILLLPNCVFGIEQICIKASPSRGLPGKSSLRRIRSRLSEWKLFLQRKEDLLHAVKLGKFPKPRSRNFPMMPHVGGFSILSGKVCCFSVSCKPF